MTTATILLLAILLPTAIIAVCYWGAGIILDPPEKSALEVFPEQFGLRYEKVSFTTRDGLLLKGWFIPSSTGDKRTVLMCHGWGDNKGHLLERTCFLNKEAGLNLLYFDHRSHGESAGKITTMGYLEMIDCDAAIDFLRANKPQCLEDLGIFGLSMGGAVAIMTMANHPEIKAAVLESPFTDYREVVRQWAWNHFHLPYFPLVMITLWMLRLRVGQSEVDEYSPIRYIGKISPRPLFLIGGSEDKLMPERGVRRLHAGAGEPKQLWIIPEAAHAECHKVGGIEYETRVAGFYQKYL